MGYHSPKLRSPERCAAPLRVQLLPAPGKVAAFSASREGEKGRPPPEQGCGLPKPSLHLALNLALGLLALSWHLLHLTGRFAARGRRFAIGQGLLPGPQSLFAAQVPPPPPVGPASFPSPFRSSRLPCPPSPVCFSGSHSPRLESRLLAAVPPVSWLSPGPLPRPSRR